MKTGRLILIALITVLFGMSAISGSGLAAAADKAPAAKAAMEAQQDSKKVAKEIPREVDINTADKAMLTRLPGIGPVTAAAIISYRETNGQFKNHDELTKVKGIGAKTLAKLKPYLATL